MAALILRSLGLSDSDGRCIYWMEKVIKYMDQPHSGLEILFYATVVYMPWDKADIKIDLFTCCMPHQHEAALPAGWLSKSLLGLVTSSSSTQGWE